MSTSETLLDGKYENWKKMMNINVIGTKGGVVMQPSRNQCINGT